MSLRSHLLNAIPDVFENFYPRALLLDPTSQIVGDSRAFAVVSPRVRAVAVHGPAARSLYIHLIPRNAQGWSILARSPDPLFIPHGWHWERAFFLRLDNPAARSPEAPAPEDVLTKPELATLPSPLREDLSAPSSSTEIFVSREKGFPVSFSHVTHRTESLFDISVDTLEAFRRKGHARRAAALAIASEPPTHQAHWGALESNEGSLRTAASLGFVRVHFLWAAEPPPSSR